MNIVGSMYPIIIIVSVIGIIYLYLRRQESKKPLELYTMPHHIPRKTKQQEEVRNNVPLVIYESWKSREVPKGMRDNIHRLLLSNPEFDYYLYSDEDCAAFIEANYSAEVLRAFHMLKPGAYKSDLWRYCILYKLGGVYLDIKYYSTVPLVNIIDEVSTVYVRDLGPHVKPLGCLYNGFMISPPKNEVFKRCIDDIVHSCENRLYKRNDLDITGPCLLGSVVQKEYSAEYIDTIQFHFSNLYGYVWNTHPAITYKDKVILKIYDTYRVEQQRIQKDTHYSPLYASRDVYV